MRRRASGQRSAHMLATFLSASGRPAGTLQYHQLQGFLFAVLSCPDLVHSSEWMTVIFAGRDAGYRTEAEAAAIMNALMRMYNDINTAILDGAPSLPADCPFYEDPLTNLEPTAPVSQWSQGFSLGHDWLRDSWTAHVPEDDDEFGMLLLVLTFFASRRLAAAYRRELKVRDSLASLAGAVRGEFPEAMREYAMHGRQLKASS